MAGGASGRAKILPYPPRDMVPIPFPLFGVENIPMLAFLVHLKSRHIGSPVALRAGEGFACDLDGKLMPSMASGAGSPAAVRVDPAHALIGPVAQPGQHKLAQIVGELASAHHLHPRTMTAVTRFVLGLIGRTHNRHLAVFDIRHAGDALDHSMENRVLLEVVQCVGLFAVAKLLCFNRVADRAIRRRDHDVDVVIKVVEVVCVIGGIQTMALEAARPPLL